MKREIWSVDSVAIRCHILRQKCTIFDFGWGSVPRTCTSDETWLWKRYAGRNSVVSTGPPAGGHECSGSSCLLDKSLWSYHSATQSPALASCAAAHIFQACLHGLPVRPWTWTDLPGRRPSAGRQDARSTTPAVIVDVGIGRRVYTTVHCRRPSVSRRRGTNMEQFASRSDRIKFPSKRN